MRGTSRDVSGPALYRILLIRLKPLSHFKWRLQNSACQKRRPVCYASAMSTTVETYDDTILTNLDGVLTSQAAEGILSLGFSEQQQQRMRELAGKARSGDLTEQERAEADSFERVSSLLGILQSKARVSMRQETQ